MKRFLAFVLCVSFRLRPRLRRSAIALATAVVSSVFPACGTAPARAEEAPRPVTAWRAIGAWSGDGSRQTESFDVTTGSLRLQWEARASGPPGDRSFKVWLYSAISGRPLQLVVDHTGTGSGTANFADDPRVSYLVVESEHTAWSMRLDEGSSRSTAQ